MAVRLAGLMQNHSSEENESESPSSGYSAASDEETDGDSSGDERKPLLGSKDAKYRITGAVGAPGTRAGVVHEDAKVIRNPISFKHMWTSFECCYDDRRLE